MAIRGLVVLWHARQRKLAVITAFIALIPLVYSLNRTAWAGAGLTAVYLAIRMAARGKMAMLGLVCAAVTIVGVAVVATPLHGLITSRFQHQQSNTIRSSLSDGRHRGRERVADHRLRRHHGISRGACSSIAVGPTANCQGCGQLAIGSNGQLYLLLVCSGWLGTAFFLGFFAYLAWRYRRDKTPYGMAGVLVILLVVPVHVHVRLGDRAARNSP